MTNQQLLRQWPIWMCWLLAGAILATIAKDCKAATPVPPADVDCGENCVAYEQDIRIVETGANVRNCWSQSIERGEVTYWDFQVLEFPDGEIATLAIDEIEKPKLGDVNHCQVWLPERAGLYSMRVRACNADGCSRWSDAWNPEHTVGHPRGFIYYIKLQSPDGGGIE